MLPSVNQSRGHIWAKKSPTVSPLTPKRCPKMAEYGKKCTVKFRNYLKGVPEKMCFRNFQPLGQAQKGPECWKYWAFWANSGPFGHVCHFRPLGCSGLFWAILGLLGHSGHFGPFWAFWAIWIFLAILGQFGHSKPFAQTAWLRLVAQTKLLGPPDNLMCFSQPIPCKKYKQSACKKIPIKSLQKKTHRTS